MSGAVADETQKYVVDDLVEDEGSSTVGSCTGELPTMPLSNKVNRCQDQGQLVFLGCKMAQAGR